MRAVVVSAALCLSISSSVGAVDADALEGSWELVSYQTQWKDEAPKDDPRYGGGKGRIVFTRGGRFTLFIVSGDQKNETGDGRMKPPAHHLAYSGAYWTSGKLLNLKADISSIPITTESFPRLISLDGDTLTLSVSLATGPPHQLAKMTVTEVWARER